MWNLIRDIFQFISRPRGQVALRIYLCEAKKRDQPIGNQQKTDQLIFVTVSFFFYRKKIPLKKRNWKTPIFIKVQVKYSMAAKQSAVAKNTFEDNWKNSNFTNSKIQIPAKRVHDGSLLILSERGLMNED